MKKIITIFFVFPLWGLGGSYAQSFQWLKRGGSNENLGNNMETVYSIATDSEKNYYVLSYVGMSGLDVDGNPKNNYDYPAIHQDVVLASFACDGTYRWSKVFGGAQAEKINSVVVDSQDNVYVGGKMQSCHPYPGTPSEPYPSQIDTEYFFSNSSTACTGIFFAKFNKNGVLQYVKRPQPPTTSSNANTYTDSMSFNIQNDVIYWYLWLPPGTYADGAFTNSNTDDYTPYILKYNLDGTFISATQLGTVQTYASYTVKYYKNPHNGYYYATILKGSSSSTFSINGQPIVNSAALVCYDNNGNFLWKREDTTTTPGRIRFYGLDFDTQNNIYIAGNITGLNNDSFLGFSYATIPGTIFIMKTDPVASSTIWVTNPSISNGGGTFGSVLYNGAEVAFVSSSSKTNFTWDSQTIAMPGANEGTDVLLARFNSATGNCLSLNKITSSTPSIDYGGAIVKDASGDYVIGGGFGGTLYDVNNSTVVNEGGDSDFFITKFSTQACLPLSSENFEEAKMNIYPNPVQNVFTVPVKEKTNYKLYTITGILVKEGSVNTTENTISISELASGCYLLHLQSESGKRESVKVIKE